MGLPSTTTCVGSTSTLSNPMLRCDVSSSNFDATQSVSLLATTARPDASVPPQLPPLLAAKTTSAASSMNPHAMNHFRKRCTEMSSLVLAESRHVDDGLCSSDDCRERLSEPVVNRLGGAFDSAGLHDAVAQFHEHLPRGGQRGRFGDPAVQDVGHPQFVIGDMASEREFG